MVVHGNKRTYLTNQEADVLEITQWSNDGYIYYTSNMPGAPGSKHFFKVYKKLSKYMARMMSIYITS